MSLIISSYLRMQLGRLRGLHHVARSAQAPGSPVL